ncbi:MAG: hypothetical protein CVV33_06970, partial [Methanomicrobiales archaeon HGW-Methanomicrobiales-4]
CYNGRRIQGLHHAIRIFDDFQILQQRIIDAIGENQDRQVRSAQGLEQTGAIGMADDHQAEAGKTLQMGELAKILERLRLKPLEPKQSRTDPGETRFIDYQYFLLHSIHSTITPTKPDQSLYDST